MENLDNFFMERALNLARRGIGKTSPNPCVGACIVKDGKIISEGYHKKAGARHAEVIAIENAKVNLKGSCLYVNLEPCSSFGRTPPCTDLIIKSKISRVVIGCIDPNIRHNGRGIEILKRAGVEVKVGVLEEKAKELNRVFFKFIKTKTPFVTLKAAITFNGKIADYRGDSKWITSDLSRDYVQILRKYSDAVITGSGTVKKDDPSLSSRLKRFNNSVFRKIILSTELSLSLSSKIFSDISEKNKVLIFTASSDENTKNKFIARGVDVVNVSRNKRGLSLKDVLKKIGALNIANVLVEAGSGLNTALLSEGLVDRIIFVIAPKILCGSDALGVFDNMTKIQLGDSVKLTDVKVRKLGDDIVIETTPIYARSLLQGR